MKNIKEKEQLIKMSLALGMEPDPKIVKEVLEYKEMMNNIRKSSSVTDVFEEISKIKFEEPKRPPEQILIPKPPSLDDISFLLEETKEEKVNLLEIPKPPSLDDLIEEVGLIEEDVVEEVKNDENKLVSLVTDHISKEVMKEQRAASMFQQPEVPLPETVSELKRKVKLLEEWITKISMTGPGSGEVNLLRLDDVDTANIANERYLRYNSNTEKIEFATISGGGGGGDVDLGNVSSNIVPTIDSTFNLGSADKRFKTLFLANNTIDLGGSLISSDGTGQISISGAGAVLPSGSRIDIGARQERIALVGDTGTVISTVPFFTKNSGLNTIAATFSFGANPDDFVFTNFIFEDGSGLETAGITQFFF